MQMIVNVIIAIIISLCLSFSCAYNPGIRLGLSKPMVNEVVDEIIQIVVKDFLPEDGKIALNQTIESGPCKISEIFAQVINPDLLHKKINVTFEGGNVHAVGVSIDGIDIIANVHIACGDFSDTVSLNITNMSVIAAIDVQSKLSQAMQGYIPDITLSSWSVNMTYIAFNGVNKAVEALFSTCEPEEEKSAGLCYPPCKSDWTGFGPLCFQPCPEDFRDVGAQCWKSKSYGRGVGYAIWNKDKCNRKHDNNCEKCLAMYYPKCRDNFHHFGCNVCTPRCMDGQTDLGIACQKKTYTRKGRLGSFKDYLLEVINENKDIISFVIEKAFNEIFGDGYITIPLDYKGSDPIGLSIALASEFPNITDAFLELPIQGAVFNEVKGVSQLPEYPMPMPEHVHLWKGLQVSVSDAVLNNALSVVLDAGLVPSINLAKGPMSMEIIIKYGSLHFFNGADDLDEEDSEEIVVAKRSWWQIIRNLRQPKRQDFAESLHMNCTTDLNIGFRGHKYNMKAGGQVRILPLFSDNLQNVTLTLASVSLILDEGGSGVSHWMQKALQTAVDEMIWTALKVKNQITIDIPTSLVSQVPLTSMGMEIHNGYIIVGANIDMSKMFDKLFTNDQIVVVGDDKSDGKLFAIE